jgi:hypothetical protein
MRGASCAWWMGLVVGCATDDDGGDPPAPCTYDVVDNVPIDDASFGFTGAEIIALASTDTTGDAAGAGLTATSAVELTHTFSTLGDAAVIAYAVSDDPSCPRGQALSVPVSYVIDGAIGDWWVQGPRLWLSLIAAAPDLESIWTGELSGGMDNVLGGAVDSELEDLARTTLGLPTDCLLGFGVGPSADELFPAPGEPDDGIRGWVNVACGDTTHDDFLTWTAERVVEPPS